MRIPRCLTALLTGLLLSATAQAQTAPGQPTLEEKKVQIWCATARFVFNDTGRPNLKNTLRCDATLREFENSIKADSQRVYSRLYQPLEGKGVMYKGLGSDGSRLQKLTNEIVRQLGSSPARRNTPERLAQVQRLEGAFNAYLTQGTPMPDDIGLLNATASEATFDSTATITANGMAEQPDLGQTEADTAGVASARVASAESPMTRLFGPIALILSLLSLVLWFLERRVLRNHISELRDRASRHRNELDSIRTTSGLGNRNAAPTEAPAELTFSQRKQIEELVERMVQQRLADLQPHGRPAAAPEPAMPTVAPAPAASAPRKNQAPAPAPERVRQAPVAPPAPARPVAVAPAAPPREEITAPAMPIPAGPPAVAPRDEFDSLVPPVQLPSPTPAPPPAPTPDPAPVGHFYVKVPVNGGFSDYDLHTVAQHDSIYEITPDPQRPDAATFRINPNSQVHAYAIQNAQYSLREACRYQPPAGPVSRIVTDEPGYLRKVGATWQIEQKAAIHFE
ncbi:hypothetical protein D3Y59_14710 [Hymenobacter oligotrophus]|uniref:Uncharacterized protein n=1 Tax=Hymenobacter oligotrophus TaxID=2319843 RepID=A0A3B7RAZ3_9BACT|nr:hypothetical protein [Hymenobacter oligotrophus]AYA38181.1 hypothetical protein D3Y59_14710 [Hymenobacter oligotrophus]